MIDAFLRVICVHNLKSLFHSIMKDSAKWENLRKVHKVKKKKKKCLELVDLAKLFNAKKMTWTRERKNGE